MQDEMKNRSDRIRRGGGGRGGAWGGRGRGWAGRGGRSRGDGGVGRGGEGAGAADGGGDMVRIDHAGVRSISAF